MYLKKEQNKTECNMEIFQNKHEKFLTREAKDSLYLRSNLELRVCYLYR